MASKQTSPVSPLPSTGDRADADMMGSDLESDVDWGGSESAEDDADMSHIGSLASSDRSDLPAVNARGEPMLYYSSSSSSGSEPDITWFTYVQSLMAFLRALRRSSTCTMMARRPDGG